MKVLKAILSLVLLSLAIAATAQVKVPQGSPLYYIQRVDGWQFDSVLAIPVLPDTTVPSLNTRKQGRLMLRSSDKKLLVYDGTHWTSTGSADTTGLGLETRAHAAATYSLTSHTHTFSSLTSKPTTIAGYGITDAFTQTLADALYSTLSHTHTFSSLTSKPTTLSGFGITDAVANTITVNGHALSSNVTVTASDLSLGNVTNTSDANKPVSTAQAAADAAVQAFAIQRANHTGTQAWSTITSTPTTLSGYGITNGQVQLNGTGFVKATGTSISYDNSTYILTSAIGSTVEAHDADLTTIAGLSPTNNDILQLKSGAWTNRTVAQYKSDLALTKSDVGLSNVPNVDATDAGNISSGVLGVNRGGAGTVNGILKADGTGRVSLAVAGTDYLVPVGAVFVSSAGTLTLDWRNDYFFTGTTATYTLPVVSPSFTGRSYSINVKNQGSGNITLNSNGGGNDIYNTSAVSTFTILPGEAYLFMPDGTYINVQ